MARRQETRDISLFGTNTSYRIGMSGVKGPGPNVTLLRAFDISLSFGSRTLFSNIELVIEAGERVGLVGVNGSGKSTLMKVLAGQVKPDSGTLQMQRGARITFLPQEPE